MHAGHGLLPAFVWSGERRPAGDETRRCKMGLLSVVPLQGPARSFACNNISRGVALWTLEEVRR
jgi:hypothetical protein